MWQGYASFGGTEVINVARLVAYAEAGSVPPDTDVDPQVGSYDALPAALGDAEYRSPLLDQPPWYDPTNPDSIDFAGLLPLDITGLEGSTRGRVVTDSIGDGGTAGRVRAKPRTIAVTAVALAASEAGLEAGVAWLTGVLTEPCTTSYDSCAGAALDLFSAPPDFCSDLPDLDADPLTTILVPEPLDLDGPTWAYSDADGALLDPVCGPVTIAVTAELGEEVAEGTQRIVVVELVDTAGTAQATGVLELPDDSPATVEVTTDPSPGYPMEWNVRLSWYTLPADVISGGGAVPLDDVISGGDAEAIADLIEAGDAGTSTVLTYGGALTLLAVTYTRQPSLTADQCLAGLRRSYRNVVTVDGPNQLDRYPLSDGEAWAATVEWTWVATDPYPYGDATNLLRGVLVGLPGGPHPAVRAASTANINLFVASPPSPPLDPDYFFVVDGVGFTVAPGGRLLLKNQDAPALNGLYDYNGAGAYLTRVDDMDTWAEAVGATVYVQEGDTQADTSWATDVTGGGTIDVTDMPWITTTTGSGGYDNGFLYKAPGIQLDVNTEVAGVDTACPVPTPVTVLCGDDPDVPPTTLPPAPPSLPDPGMPDVTEYVRRAFQVPPELSLIPGAVLKVVVRSLSPVAYRGIRVRLWADADPDFGVDDECAFEQELYIAYLPPSETLTIDGPNHLAWITCPEGLTADHTRNMRGPYGGPFAFPELRCGARYHVTVDVPVTDDATGVSVDVTAYRRGA